MDVREDVMAIVQDLPEPKLEAAKRYLESLREECEQEETQPASRKPVEGPRYRIVPLPYEALDALMGILDSPDLAGDALADTEALYDEV